MSRHIAVTGSASGIGQALAEQLIGAGDTVIGIDLKDADVCADLGTPTGRAQAVEAVLERCGGVLDGLVACAGINTPSPALVSVNFFGVTALAEGLRPALAAAAAPRAAVVGSISGTQPVDDEVVAACLAGDEAAALARAEVVMGEGPQKLYPSSKAALAQWVRRDCVTPQWAGAGIPLNVVAPGVVRTPMSAALFADERMKQVMDRAVPMPLNGYAGPEVIAEALSWLIGPSNTHMTGQVLYVDGGAEVSLRGPAVF
ncbi:SDR family oxidoreductase [Blastococcus sp. BMG 814]|uniref:SDR family oxidoreductase n=1 Tax=Blastococcus carthaginiensis TaxID=3050034 RepID=A0ABT9I8J4_9ACTN|nr:SDR family oxidoreductase [Blastococcus carthaginiensis]MDP5181890.1 SDR family oxidoreductase [Blastococcus carthaginiensis]